MREIHAGATGNGAAGNAQPQPQLGKAGEIPIRPGSGGEIKPQMDAGFQEITPFGALPRQTRRGISRNLLLSAFIRVHLRLKFQISNPG
jgi:hypothetical protein